MKFPKDISAIRKLKEKRVLNIREILSKKKLDEFELDLVMNDLI